ncbi:MAG: ABC transporter permease subunit [Actinomycetales bacterium]|nr:ABC transporter permease subunit [Actinomycetales bacterium]
MTNASVARPSTRRWGSLGAGSLAIPPLAVLAAFFLVPVVVIGYRSLFVPEFSLVNYTNLFTKPSFLRTLVNSASISLIATAYALVLGSVLLRALIRSSQWIRAAILVSLVLPLVTGGELVRLVAWKIILSPEGPLNSALMATGLIDSPLVLIPNRFAVIVGLLHVMLPLFVLTAFSAIRLGNVRLHHAAQGMGSTPLQTFLTADLPKITPAVLAALLVTFVIGFGTYATPSGLGGPGDTVLPQLVIDQLKLVGDTGQAAAAGVLLLAVALLVLVLLTALGGIRAIYSPAGSGAPRSARNMSLAAGWTALIISKPMTAVFRAIHRAGWLRGLTKALLALITLLLVLFLIAPTVIGVVISFTESSILTFPPKGFSFHWYGQFFTDPVWVSATKNSVVVGVISAIVATALGTMTAYALVRGRFRRKTGLMTYTMLPLLIPWVVAALGLYLVLVQIGAAYTLPGLVIGHVIIALPFAVVLMTPAMSTFDWTQDRAAQVVGASPLRRFYDVLLPHLRPSLFISLWFCLVTSFTEIAFALLMSNTYMSTLPVVMFDGIRYNVSPTVAAAGGVLTAVTVGALALGFLAHTVATKRTSSRRN